MRRALRPAALATAGYVVITCIYYWNGVRHLASHYISDGGDGSAFLWAYWHLPEAVLDGRNPFSAPDLFFPVGVRLAYHTTTPLEAGVAWLLSLVVGSVLAVNLVNLGGVVLTGLGGWLLARHECHDDRAAFVAGAAFLLIPQHAGRISGHWNLSHAWVLPFALWALLRVYDDPTWKRALVLGVFAAVAFWTDLTYFIFFILAAGLIALWRRRETVAAFGKLAGGAAAAGVLSAPLALPMLMDYRNSELDKLLRFGGAHEHSADLAGFFVPKLLYLWTDGLGLDAAVFGLEEYPYAGLLITGLAVAAVLTRRRHGPIGPWLLIAGVFSVLALGPFLHVNGWTGDAFSKFGFDYTIPLPFYVFHSIPILSGLRIPGRFSIMGGLALAVAASVALARYTRGRPVRLQWAVPALALAITMFELLPGPRVPVMADEVPHPYQAIRHHPDQAAVLEVPLYWRDGFGQVGDPANHDVQLYYATTHERPLVSGMVARLPVKRRAALYGYPVFRQLLTLQHQAGFSEPPDFGPRELRAMGIGFVVYHRDRPSPDALAYIEGLRLEPLADDGTTVVWHVP